jgi:UDP:flavonoid glycosyltransferase YjiC (YdhE family)
MSPVASDPLTVLFMPESAHGPTNNCVGIGDLLRARGHRVVFAAERSWAGTLDALGFEEDLVDLSPSDPDAAQQDAGQFWADFVAETAPEFRKPTIEQLATFMQPTWQALIEGSMFCDGQLRDILERHHPDIVVEDNVVSFPALETADVPFVRIMSCQPLELPGPAIPPAYSGYPTSDDSAWAEFRAEYDRTHRDTWATFDDWVRSVGGRGLPDLEFIGPSPDLNLYVYPDTMDYLDRRPLGATWHRLESSVRATDETFEIPEVLRAGEGSLVYLSLGSLGSADVDLMSRLIGLLSETPHRYIVSMGPRHERLALADNMWGAPTLPQTNVLPLVDLVITHGGNNTTTECCHFGKPMVVLPIFWDQHDNAQRVEESGLGVRLDTYRTDGQELGAAIDRLLGDDTLRRRMDALGEGIRADRGTARAAELIEQVALEK